ncbi:arginine biosynthesis bifunctional protein ArgJ, chloroplastic isoform X2 [Jatropha curcas]|uniref:arginine biosynthesis bifunctional protein ArgJ, chloroplastic isoform X2 n=1 Tax=Jatropha curcas TaxID=180498 RepID=UPI0005FB1B2F|nr:arginine biosynthesis bifunctional protein ArgJ, chloroplastic isoform X2 [Jatropha curcas]
MYCCVPHYVSMKFPELSTSKIFSSFSLTKRDFKVFAVASSMDETANYIPAAPIFIPEGPWNQIPGGVTAAKGFKAAGIYGGLRAQGNKPDLALVTCDVDAAAAGAFTTNMVAAAPVLYCKNALDISKTARAVLINAGQANAATGDAGYQDVLECADALAKVLNLKQEEVLIESTGVIGHRIKKEALLNALPELVNSLTSSLEGAGSAAVAITTTDLVSKSVAIESQVGDMSVRVGGMAKGSGMIHPNMATMLGVITTDALVEADVWRKMVLIAVNRSFNQITVDGDTSTNDTVIALASGLSGSTSISSIECSEARQLQACLDAVMQALAKSVAWDGEGATCLIEVTVTGAESEVKAAKIARSVASSSLVKAAVYGRDPNWGRIAAAAGYAGIPFHQNNLRVMLGDILLMDNGQPLAFDRKAGETHGTVGIYISVGDGSGHGQAWGCDLSYDYVKINAEYTT